MRAPAHFTRVLIYARDMERTAAYYARHFGFTAVRDSDGRIIELAQPGGMTLMVHQAAKSRQRGQSAVKLVFDTEDVEDFVAATSTLKWGAVHRADGYCFANCKDPEGNAISVSSRVFRKA